MATHSIGKNKVMLSVPLDRDLMRQLGRRSYKERRYGSKAAIARKLLELYLKGSIVLPLIALGLFASAAGCACAAAIAQPALDDPIHRVPRSVRAKKRGDGWMQGVGL